MTRLHVNLLLLFIALIWGSTFVAQSHGMADVGPMTFTGVRFLIGSLVVAPLMWREWQALKARGLALNRDDGLKIVGLGLFITMGAAMQQVGMVSSSVTHAVFLTALYVPLVPMLSWLLLRAAPHWSVWPAASGSLAGTYLLSGAHSISLNTGDLWVMASALPWALHVLLVGRVADRMAAPFLVAGGQFLVCGVISLTWAAVAEPISATGLQAALLPILYAGVLSVGVAFTAQVVAQRYAQAADAAIILSSETLFAAFFGYALMGDRLDTTGLLGCALILACIVLVQIAPIFKLQRRVATP